MKILCATAHTRWPAVWMVQILTIIFTPLECLLWILRVFAVPPMWLLVQHGCRCNIGKGCIASSVSHNWGWKGGKIFSFKIHSLKSTPGTPTKGNSDTPVLTSIDPSVYSYTLGTALCASWLYSLVWIGGRISVSIHLHPFGVLSITVTNLQQVFCSFRIKET